MCGVYTPSSKLPKTRKLRQLYSKVIQIALLLAVSPADIFAR
jgi:hypothetical protein